MKLKLHPLYVVLAVIMILLGQGRLFFFSAAAALLHECAHYLAARERGYLMRETVLMPYGAVLCGNERMDKKSESLIAIAGPAASLITALITAASWWLFPASYVFTRPFFDANLMLCLFNLLPAFPLDGSRIVLGFSKNRIRTLKRLKIVGIAFSFILLALCLMTFPYTLNLSFGILAVFLFVGSVSGTEKELYLSVADTASGGKDYLRGVEEKIVVIDGGAPLSALLKHIGNRRLVTFSVISDGSPPKRISENALRPILQNNDLRTPIRDVLSA
jgi:Zn-dependent protease